MSSLKSMYTAISDDPFPPDLRITLGDQKLVYKKRVWTIDGEERGLRYGENPDQPAAVYELVEGSLNIGSKNYRPVGQSVVSALNEARMIQAGKHPGKTNFTDVDNAINILQYLTAKPAALILKHNNPCGAAWSDAGIADALEKAFWCDRIAAFGGAVVINRPMDLATAAVIDSAYFEVAAAPFFEPGVLEILGKRKNLRIMELPDLADLSFMADVPFLDIKSLSDGGLVLQQSFLNRIRTADDFLPASANTKDGLTVVARKPSKAEADDLLFAWAVEAGVISNSVIFAKDGATVAIGTGEQDRVGCVELAVHKAYTKYADKLVFKKIGLSLYELTLKAKTDNASADILAECRHMADEAKGGLAGAAMVSDGFFPFRDGVDAAMIHDIKAIAQPGGSLRDAEVITAVNEQDVAMVFTGQRSFKH